MKMNKALLSTWQKQIDDFIKSSPAKYGQDAKRYLQINQKHLQETWANLTAHRGASGEGRPQWKTAAQHGAYLLGFHGANLMRMAWGWQRIHERHGTSSPVAEETKIHIHDLGCGAGAMSLATAAFLTHPLRPDILQELEVHLVDRSRQFLNMAASGHEHLLNTSRFETKVMTHVKNLNQWKGFQQSLYWQNILQSPHDVTHIFMLGYVINEGANSFTLSMVRDLKKRKKKFLFFIMEPATDYQAKKAMKLRDDLVMGNGEGLFPLYPCPNGDAPCPLDSKANWCFSEAPWDRPPVQQQVDELMGVNRSRLRMALYALSSETPHQKESKPICVGHPFVLRGNKGKQGPREILVCTGTEIKKRPHDRKSPLPLRGTPVTGV